jgi:hypothetical protein
MSSQPQFDPESQAALDAGLAALNATKAILEQATQELFAQMEANRKALLAVINGQQPDFSRVPQWITDKTPAPPSTPSSPTTTKTS